ncbi:hypothetical protein [Streptomyces lunaelactis]|uniref:hypothetical protein n=1 Tax=Streptomyces lunaelactis TaxID=1535768 RepID=UPI00359F303F
MEVAHSPSRVHVRDSKNLQGPTHQHGSGRLELLRAVRRTELTHSGGAADGITLRHRSHWYCAPIATATMSHIQMTCTASTGLRDVDYCPCSPSARRSPGRLSWSKRRSGQWCSFVSGTWPWPASSGQGDVLGGSRGGAVRGDRRPR